MKREDFIKKIKIELDLMEEEPLDKDIILTKYNRMAGRNGIYLLLNQHKKVIYVGKVGRGNYTSLYKRLYGHGSGAHCKKSWFQEVKYFKFKRYENAGKEDLLLVERLMVFAFKQPIYNDISFTPEYEEVYSRLTDTDDVLG